MATIKAIEDRSVHQIQSGQVIVDLCSVVKELVENSLDAGATSVDVRFKNNGLDSIEVQDNGVGISPEDYDTIALKHYTSKLSNYDDLGTLNTFGFRGEALSSLCALSKFHIITARDGEAPRGTRLDFEISGKLKNTTIAASQKGTTVAVEELFHNLPVRRRELEKNVKREYSKAVGILHAYACISTGVKFGVSNQVPKGKKMIVFSTKANPTTRDNIANVFGAKTLSALTSMDLELELQPTTSQVLTDIHTQNGTTSRNVRIVGHISRPVFGEGRQTPDRQMFFVNSRPCGPPQISKAFNEVYKAFNVSQSPFIFANLLMDTNSYDVNVSPDKRTILLHDQTRLLETIKEALMNMFEAQDQTVPQSQVSINKLPVFRPLTVNREASIDDETRTSVSRGANGREPLIMPSSGLASSSTTSEELMSQDCLPGDLVSKFAARNHEQRREAAREKSPSREDSNSAPSREKQKLAKKVGESVIGTPKIPDPESDRLQSDALNENEEVDHFSPPPLPRAVQDFNARIASQQVKLAHLKTNGHATIHQRPIVDDEEILSLSPSPRKVTTSVVQTAYERMRPKRVMAETATITIGEKTTTAIIGSSSPLAKRCRLDSSNRANTQLRRADSSQFAQKLRAFAGPGSQLQAATSGVDDDLEVEEEDATASPLSDKSTSTAEVEEVGDEAPAEGEISELDAESDDEYLGEEEKKKLEETRVNKLIEVAEAAAAQPSQANLKRAASLLKSQLHKESTLNLVKFLDTSCAKIEDEVAQLNAEIRAYAQQRSQPLDDPISTATTAEERLSLTITRSDFASMRIIGQFNLGFILATRSSTSILQKPSQTQASVTSDLFIIDQHASDEIYNFTRLSKTTTLTPQPLVHPHPLHLTAIEEEIILTHRATLAANGFTVSFDDTSTSYFPLPIGKRCALLTLPTSRGTVFSVRDLEELIALLAEATPAAGEVVRPTRVRKMLAMRACRSSVMVGKTLSARGMEMLVRHMGEIERPWNCPHGRPTMRHLAGLGEWEGWLEGEGLVGDDGGVGGGRAVERTDWKAFVDRARKGGLLAGAGGGAHDEEDEEEEEDGGEEIDAEEDGLINGAGPAQSDAKMESSDVGSEVGGNESDHSDEDENGE